MSDNWNECASDYKEKVYSITLWKEKRRRILNKLKDSSKILILGAGSENILQKSILEEYPNSNIVISDLYEEMINVSKKTFNHKNLKFKVEDMRSISYTEEFDFVISTNSILMPTIKENNKVFHNCLKALKKDGELISYLPSFESAKYIVSKINNNNLFKFDHENQTITDGADSTIQSFHTKKSIKNISNIFSTVSTEKVFCSESKEEIDQLYSIYKDFISIDTAKEIYEWFSVFKK